MTPRIQAQLKLRPTCAQAATFDRWLWHLTGVYNWTVKTLEHEPKLTAIDLKKRLKGHGVKIGINAQAVAGTVDTAHTAWSRYRSGISGRPRLKGRRRRLNSIAFPNGLAKGRGLSRPFIPSIGPVRAHKQDVPAGHCGYARLVKRASGWYLCLFIKAVPKPIERTAFGQVGVDPGFSALLTLSTGEAIPRAAELARGENRLAQAQRGGRKRLTARLRERIRNQRQNRNHHLSRRLVSENTLIAFSKDSTSSIARRFGKSVAAAGHTQLRSMLAYKSRLGGSEYIEVPSRNSTKACSVCGALTGPSGLAGLSVRQWQCGACGAQHDRDINAAVNTLIAARGMRVKNGREAVPGISSLATPSKSITHGSAI